MSIRLSDEARRYLAVFDQVTDARATDCVVDDETIVFIVTPDDMAAAIGPGGRTVQELEDRFGRSVVLIEGADTPEYFVANALAPAAVYDVEVDRTGDEPIAIAFVDPDDMGVAIGAGGSRIDRARRLVKRHFGIADIQLEAADPPKDGLK